MTGVVKFFNAVRGYGFIRCGKGEPDVFFHESALANANARQVGTGQEVEYDLLPGYPEPRALSVRLLSKRSYIPITERKAVAHGD